MQRKSAIVYVTYDGAVNSASGVGVISRYFIEAIPQEIRAIENQSDLDLSFHVLAVNLADTADGYSAEIRQQTESICHSLEGELHLIDNGMNGEKGYGGPENWRLACQNAAATLSQIASEYDHTIVYLVDTPFMCLPFYYPTTSPLEKITFVIVPHSDTFSHFPDNIELKRLSWEATSMQALIVFPNVFLAKTSDFLLSTLKAHYKIPPERIVPMQTGLVPSSPRFMQAGIEEITEALKARCIPLDKKLIFSVGRGVHYKGFADLINSFARLHEQESDSHLVFIAPPHKNEAGITPELEALISGTGIGKYCTPIYELDMELPRLICQWPHTRIVAQLSHREPFGLVPEEVRLWSRTQGPIIVASNLDGFVEQITDGQDGFLVQPHDHQAVADTLANILHLPTADADTIRQNGWRRALRDYDYTKSVNRSLVTLLEKVTKP
jgi:D-inositol-3-phosphate glycosyltransferase